ncbi:MAG: hypothetical protein FWD78_07930 [Treponema sp.]|nr:hypothetical protein [Treponema sp.]
MKRTLRFRFTGVLIMLVMIAVFGAAVMLLWNALMPGLLNLPALNYWQAAGILLLTRILFGGLGGGLTHRGVRRTESLLGGHAGKLREKWMKMSEDERKEFINKVSGDE